MHWVSFHFRAFTFGYNRICGLHWIDMILQQKGKYCGVGYQERPVLHIYQYLYNPQQTTDMSGLGI